MLLVSDTEAAAIQSAYARGGRLAAVAETRRLYPGLTEEAAWTCARLIAWWEPPAAAEPSPEPDPVVELRPRRKRRRPEPLPDGT